MSWRGTCLILEPSKLYLGAYVLRHPSTMQAVATPNSRRAAVSYCRTHGYSWMNPVKNVSLAKLEARD